MTSLLEGARKLVTRGTDVGARIEGLATATEAARGRLDDELVERAATVVDRGASRLRLSAHHTVVGIAGATGSGKSSTFNALTGLELSAVGVRRPTTSWATACVWGTEGAAELLEWLGLRGLEHRRTDELSGGQAQRVALARALAPRPAVLGLDEPFSALDTDLRRRLVADVGTMLREAGVAALHVTHDREEATAIADRVIELSSLGAAP